MKNIYRLLLLFFSFYFLQILANNLLDLDKVLLNFLYKNFTNNQIEALLVSQNKWEWVNYVFTPIYITIKLFVISSVLYIGCFFFCKKEILFKEIFNLSLKAEFIFLLIPILKIIWFYFFQPSFILEDIQYFYPFSALNITGYKGIEPWLLYPLQTLNLFEVAYIIYLSYQIGSLTKTNADIGLKIVGYSYVPALLLWVTVVMFFTLNYS